MELIPNEWSVRLISPFLIGLSRDSLHASRNTKLRKNLMRAENIKVSGILVMEVIIIMIIMMEELDSLRYKLDVILISFSFHTPY